MVFNLNPMKKYLLFLAFFMSSLAFAANFPEKLSNSAQISVIIIGQDESLHGTFGESALRVYDSEQGLDALFTFQNFSQDFTTYFFYNLMLTKIPYSAVEAHRFTQYFLQNQWVKEHSWEELALNLTVDEMDALYCRLIDLTGTAYPYDFYDLNSSKMIWSLVDFALRNEKVIHLNDSDFSTPVRSIVFKSLSHRPLVRYFMTLMLGFRADKKLKSQDSLFTSQNLSNYLKNSFIVRTDSGESENHPLVLMSRKLGKDSGGFRAFPFYFNLIFLGAIFILSLAVSIFQMIKYNPDFQSGLDFTFQAFDLLLYSLAGIAGFILLANCIFSSQELFRFNFNWLWLFPLHFAAGFTVFKKNKSRTMFVYWLLTLLLCVVPFLIFRGFYFEGRLEQILTSGIIFARSLFQVRRHFPFKNPLKN